MDAASFKAAWESSGDQLCRYPPDTISASKLPEDKKHFLATAGLPVEAAPFLSFGPIALDWLGISGHEQDHLYALGSDGSGDPIVIDEHGVVWLIDHEEPAHRSLVNSSISALAECLLAYRALVEKAIAIAGDDAVLDGLIPVDLAEVFSKSVDAADPAAAKVGTFWGGEVSRLISEAS